MFGGCLKVNLMEVFKYAECVLKQKCSTLKHPKWLLRAAGIPAVERVRPVTKRFLVEIPEPARC